MTTLSWMFRLTDRVTGPARQITRELRGVRSELSGLSLSRGGAGARGGIDTVRSAIGSLARSVTDSRAPVMNLRQGMSEVSRSGISMQSVMGAAGSTLSMVATAAAAAGAAILGVGAAGARSAIDLARFQENSMVTLRTLLGSDDAARNEWGRAMEFARRTPFDTQDVIRMRTGLVSAGFSDSRERDVMSAWMADVAALNPNNSSAMQQALLIISQVRANDRAMGNDLMQLGNLGINRRDIFREIARGRGLQNVESAAVSRQMGALVSAGRVNSNEFLRALVTSMSARTGGTGVGALTGNMNGTIEGNLSNLQSSLADLLLGNEGGRRSFFQGAGMTEMNRALGDTVALLAASSSTGARLQKVLRNLVDTVFKTLFGRADRSTIETTITSITDGLETLTRWFVVGWKFAGAYFDGLRAVVGPVIDTLGEFFKSLSSGDTDATRTMETIRNIGKVVGVLASVSVIALAVVGAAIGGVAWAFGAAADFITGAWGSIISMVSSAPEFFSNLGTNIVEGLKSGLEGAWQSLLDLLRGLASGLPDPVREALGIHSPSTVFAELGQYTAEGLALGIERGAGRAQSAAQGLLDVGGLDAGGFGALGGRGGVTIEQLTIHVNGGDDADETGQRIAASLFEALRHSMNGSSSQESEP